MLFYYFSLFLLSFLHISGSPNCHLCVMVSDRIAVCFLGRRGLPTIEGHLESQFLMFFRHTASKFTGTVKLWFLIGLLSLSKDSSTAVESIYWLKCVLLRYDGWPHAPFQLVSSRPFSRWPFTSQTQSACSISRQTGHVSTTWHAPDKRLQLSWIHPNKCDWMNFVTTFKTGQLAFFHHLFSQLVTMWSFPLLASRAGHNETHPQLPPGPVILWLAEMNQIRHGSVRDSDGMITLSKYIMVSR